MATVDGDTAYVELMTDLFLWVRTHKGKSDLNVNMIFVLLHFKYHICLKWKQMI